MIADDSLSSAFDDLADLFLGGPVQGPIAGQAPGPATSSHAEQVEYATHLPALVEGVILGHLPAMAALWATQYPRMLARSENVPVAFVRVDGQTARVEVFTQPTPTPEDAHRSNHPHVSRLGTEARPSTDLSHALRTATRLARRIVVCAASPADERLLAARTPTLALLTGADDASAVAAYKAIKRLAPTANHPSRIRVAVMGSDGPKAEAAFHRLADAVRSFLSVPIESAGHCRQIASGLPGTLLFDGPSAMTVQGVLDELDQQPLTERPERSMTHASSTLHPPAGGSHNSLRTQAGPDEPLSTTLSTFTLPVTQSAAATTPPTSTSTPLPPGLTPLPVRCPFERAPVLALDQQGHPHVIATTQGQSTLPVESLLAVSAWFWESRELLNMLCPALSLDARPTLHLITPNPAAARRLLDTDLRIHLHVLSPGLVALN